jgi:hypothetical protein
MGLFGAISGIAGGVIGAISGAQGDKTSSNFNSNQISKVNLQNFSDINQGASGLENAGYSGQLSAYNQLSNLISQGPGASAITDANSAANQYSSLLSQFINNSGLPTAQQTTAAQGYAQSIFAPQQTALQQAFITQGQNAARSAAAMGRSGADPALMAKLGISETQQQALLNSQQGAFAAQTAMSMPQQQLDMASALYGVKSNLASQAMNNRANLLALGNQLTNSERNYRLQTASRTNTSSGSQSSSSGGGLAGAINGGIAGIGSGIKAFGQMSSMFSGSPKSVATAGSSNLNAGVIA